MSEECKYSTKVENTVSGFSTNKCEKLFSQYKSTVITIGSN
jgi:hypothetical protein